VGPNQTIERGQIKLTEPLLPLATLFAVDHNSPYYHEHNKSSIFYAESWAVVHYFMSNERHENAQPLSDYMKLLSQNVDAVTAATRAFGDLKQLQAALDKYVAHASFRYFKMPISAEIDAATFKIQAVTPAKADAVRADFLAYNQRIKDAKPLLERVLRDDPSNASAHETMGYLEFRQGNLDEARKWYEQAVKLNSQSFLAYYYFAAITMNGGQLDSGSKSQVENSLRTAIKLNPRLPQLTISWQSFMECGARISTKLTPWLSTRCNWIPAIFTTG
jgi:tetratricopeptide (TPR) repeat protein